MNRYPIYILSKGRFEKPLTAWALDKMGIKYNMVIEEQEYDSYKKTCPHANLIILDMSYKDNYDACDDKGMTISKGSGPARNFIRDHSIKMGYKRHRVIDDNIRSFKLLNKNKKITCYSKDFFSPMEDLVDRYENIGLAGPYYDFFIVAGQTTSKRPLILNTRAFSCILINNDMPLRWRSRYNEDIELSLRAMKSGYAIVQFTGFLQQKMRTQTMKGGNTDAFYAAYGTSPKSRMLQTLHPDCVEVVSRYGREHHRVTKVFNIPLIPTKERNEEYYKQYNFTMKSVPDDKKNTETPT